MPRSNLRVPKKFQRKRWPEAGETRITCTRSSLCLLSFAVQKASFQANESQERTFLFAKIVVKPLQEFQSAVLQIAALEEQRNPEVIFKIRQLL